jgi:hypothetical protein
MLKRLCLAFAGLFLLLPSAFAAGTIPGLSLSQRFDAVTSKPLNGGKLYFFAAGTTTPQLVYQDSALTLPYPHPITLDAGGNVPQLFAADGSIKFRLANSAGVTQLAADGILVVGASSGGGGGSPVDATTILATGDLKVRYGTGALSGFVRANGRTIGSATSGASERANADCQTLFEYLWTADTNLSVSTGRGASANADWVANKTITLPDWRGRALAALDDMGNTAAGRLTSTYFGTSAIVLGAASTGLESRTIQPSWLPPYTPSGTVASSTSIAGGTITNPGSNVGFGGSATGGAFTNPSPVTTSTFTGTAQGGTSTPFSIIQPTMLATIYIKL